MTKQDWIFIFVVIFFAGAIRFSNFLESVNVLRDAKGISDQLLSIGLYNGNFMMPFFGKVQTFFNSFFLEQALKDQLLPIILGLASIFLFYIWMKRISSDVSARVGTIIFAFSFWHMTLSRFIPDVSFIIFTILLSLYICWSLMRKASFALTAVLALLCGFMLSSSIIFWPFVIAIIVAFVLFVGFHEEHREFALTKFHMDRLLGIFIIVFTISIVPLILKIYNAQDYLMSDIFNNSITNNLNISSTLSTNASQIILNLGINPVSIFNIGVSTKGILSGLGGIIFILGLGHSIFRLIKHRASNKITPLGQLTCLMMLLGAVFFGLFLKPELAALSFVILAMIPVFAYMGTALGWIYSNLTKIQENQTITQMLVRARLHTSNNMLPKVAISLAIIAFCIQDISRFLKLVSDIV